jgi:hypothetical protein
MTKAELPEGWHYTGKTFHRNLEERGVLRHFYWCPEQRAIYQVIDIRKQRQGGEIPGIMKFPGGIEVYFKFVNPKDPERIRRIRHPSYSLEYVFLDREVRLR